MGNGVVAFASGSGAAVWQFDHARDDRAADPFSAEALLTQVSLRGRAGTMLVSALDEESLGQILG